MTSINAYIDRSSKKIIAAISGTAEPSVLVVLGEWLSMKLAWVSPGGVIEALPDDTPVTLVVKAGLAHDAAPLALDVSADETGSGASKRYTLKSLIDCAALRTALEGKDGAEFMLQVTWGVAGEESFGATLPLAITVENNYSRDGDAVPDPLTSAGWTKIKAFIPESDAVTHNEDEKVIEINAGGGAVDSVNGQTGVVVLDKGDIGLGNVNNTSDANKPVSTAQQTALDGKADLVGGKVPSSQLPSYVDDVIEGANLAAFPGTGETGKIYVAIDTGKIYRWSGSAYIEISATPAIASQAEAEAGTDNAKLMTPLRVAQAIAEMGGSGGLQIAVGAGTLQGYTSSGTPAEPPPALLIEIISGGDGTVSISFNAVSYVFTFAPADPSDGSYWIDDSSLTDATSFAGALANGIDSILMGVSGANYTVSAPAAVVTLSNNDTGSGSEVSCNSNSLGTFGGGGLGSDEVPPSGEQTEVELVAAETGKVLRPLQVMRCGPGMTAVVQIALRVGVEYTPVTEVTSPGSETVFMAPLAADHASAWFNGIAGASLVAIISGEIPSGGTLDIYALAVK